VSVTFLSVKKTNESSISLKVEYMEKRAINDNKAGKENSNTDKEIKKSESPSSGFSEEEQPYRDPRPWMSKHQLSEPVYIKTPYRKSMAKKISASYMNMFSRWMNIIFTLIFILYVGIYGGLYYYHVLQVKQSVQEINSFPIFSKVEIKEPPFVTSNAFILYHDDIVYEDFTRVGNMSDITSGYLDEANQILAETNKAIENNFGNNMVSTPESENEIVTNNDVSSLDSSNSSSVMNPMYDIGDQQESSDSYTELRQLLNKNRLNKGPVPIRLDMIQNRFWFAVHVPVYSSYVTSLTYSEDITFFVLQGVIVFGAALLLFFIASVSIRLQGSYSTRKTFKMLDEFTNKISAISSENLNLRMNVRDSTTELVDLVVTFNRMMERLEGSYNKQNRFVSDASHELRTPISVIQGYARMLERWGKNDPAILNESIAAISNESKNMQDLVEKLLFIARNDKDKLVLTLEVFDFSELMGELCKDTKMMDTGLEIRCDTEPNVWIYADKNRIKQALRVFIDNAIKFTEKGKFITLQLKTNESWVEASVKDSGIGIPEKDLPNIFDRFYRVDEARERNTGGHGLGLSIARIIILRHGGKITVASKVNVGTKFTIKLPKLKNS